jgi:hypothetical protein
VERTVNTPTEQPAPRRGRKAALVGAAVLVSFLTLTGVIITLARTQVVTPQVGLLMFVALIGMYVGFGILIGTWRLIEKL